MARIDELIVYREPENGELLREMAWIMENYGKDELRVQMRERFFSCMHRLVELAGTYGFLPQYGEYAIIF